MLNKKVEKNQTKRYKNCIIIDVKTTKFTEDLLRVSMGSYLFSNYRDSYEVHLLNYKGLQKQKLTQEFSNYANLKFIDGELLEYLWKIKSNFEFIILLDQATLTLERFDKSFDFFSRYELCGGAKYYSEFIYKHIPFVKGVFSRGFMLIHNIQFELDDIDKFSRTFNIGKNNVEFAELFISFVATTKLKLDISNESCYFHSENLRDLSLIYFSDNPAHEYPWIVFPSESKCYITWYLDKYLEFANLCKCTGEFIRIIGENVKHKFNIEQYFKDLNDKFKFKSWDKVFIPANERTFKWNKI